MTVFGDATPEDAWDRDDDPAVQLDNVIRRAVALNGRRPRTTPLRDLDDVAAFVFALRRTARLDAGELLRADLIDEDVAYLRGRL